LAEKKTNEGAENGLSLEEAFARLDELLKKMEDREIPLEESFAVYKEGMDLLKQSREKIDTVEKKMLQIDEEGELREF
jgi:exodeoxyribonuclease VII small subunit